MRGTDTPRRVGGFRRRWVASALSAALLTVGLGAAGVASAAVTISVPCTGASGGTAGLATAIASADTGGGGTITLASGCVYLFTSPYANTGSQDLADWYGPAALPAIAAPITIVGNGATIGRSTAGGTPPFRLFFVGASATAAATSGWTTPGGGLLALENVTLSGGLAQGGGADQGGGGLGAGGAIYSQGTVVLSAVTLSGNGSQGGPAGDASLGEGGGGIAANAPATGNNGGGGFGTGFTAPTGAPTGGTGGTGVLTNDGGGGAGFATTESGAPATLTGAGAGGGSLTGTAGDAETSDGAKGGDGGGGGSGTAALTAGGGGGAYGEGGTGATTGGAGGGGVGGGGGGATNGAGGGFGGGGGYPGGGGGFGGGGASSSGLAGFGAGAGGSAGGGGGAGLGGAIFNQQGTLVAENTTLAANVAGGGAGGGTGATAGMAGSGFGGAIFSLNGIVALINDTVAANTASDGGALYVLGYDAHSGATKASVALVNDILSTSDTSANVSIHDLVVAKPSTVADGTTNAASAGATVPATNIVVSDSGSASGGTISGTPLTANPMLGVLMFNGGPGMQTMLPAAGSPALEAGTTSGAPSTDERGTSRPPGGPIDLGAVQLSTASTTTVPVPVVVDGQASAVTASTATLNATVDPAGLSTKYYFEYGLTARYGSKTRAVSIGSGTSAVPVSVKLTKLKSGRTYHFRVVATNSAGTSNGIGRVFTTALPAISRLTATAVPRHALKFPYRFAFSGKVKLPHGVTGKACSGTVSVKIERGRKTVLSTRGRVGGGCGWKVSTRLDNDKLVPGHGKLSVIVSFSGNTAFAPHTNKAFTVLYG